MKKLTHSESEIVKSVNELEAGVSADEICRRLNVSRATLYQWKRKYGGLEVSQLKKLKELEEENAKLKKMYANLALDNEILREVIEKNSSARGLQGNCGRNSGGTRHQHYSGVQIDGHPQVILLLRINQGRFRSRGCDTAEGRGCQRWLLENIQADSQGWASVEP